MTAKEGTKFSESHGDHAHAVVRAALGALPLGGSAAVELFNTIVTPPIERRRRAWMQSVGEALKHLQETAGGIDVVRLSEDEAFITLLLATTRIAMQNHTQEKLDALRNAVLNSACGKTPVEEIRDAFLGFIERFTLLHIRLLVIFSDGFVWNNGEYPHPEEDVLPPFLVPNIGSYYPFADTDRQLLAVTLRELVDLKLVQPWRIFEVLQTNPDGSFECSVSQWENRSSSPMQVKHGAALQVDRQPGCFIMRTSTLGSSLVNFISRPPVTK
jgi:hypothetical protein